MRSPSRGEQQSCLQRQKTRRGSNHQPARAGLPTHQGRSSRMGKVKTRKTAEQRQAEMNELHEQSATKVEELRDPERWKTVLRWAAAFRSYRCSDVLLSWPPMPEPPHAPA